jgi:hypothetical protein
MFKTRFFQILFSLAVITAMCLAMTPAPVYALSASTTASATVGSAVTQVSAPVLPTNVFVCRIVVVRHNGHITIVRHCHRVDRQNI